MHSQSQALVLIQSLKRCRVSNTSAEKRDRMGETGEKEVGGIGNLAIVRK